jgi:hypothetical protein
MDYGPIIAAIILVGAIGGFVVLSLTIMRNWRAGTREAKRKKLLLGLKKKFTSKHDRESQHWSRY